MTSVVDVEKIIEDYVREKSGDDMLFTTGWVAVVSLSSPTYDGSGQDTYITIRSDGMPHHSMLGLFEVGKDINTLDFGFVDGDDDVA